MAGVLSNARVHIKIYNDNNGELETDRSFTLNTGCSFSKIDSIVLFENISGYDGNKIFLTLPEQGEKCFLMPN